MRERKFRNRKCFDELFTRDEFKLANGIRGTYDCGYSLIALNDQTQVTGWCHFGIRISRYMTLRFYYATQVWQEALFILSEELRSHFCFGKPVWESDGNGFKFIKFEQDSNKSLSSKISRFWEILRDVADSKRIFVSEQTMRENQTLDNEYERFSEEIKITYILDKSSVSEYRGYSPDLSKYNFSSEKKTYSWDEIKDLFVEISPRILSLVHYRNMNDCNPDDAATSALHKACEEFDISAARQALKDGADPNGFDKYGNTPLVLCLENFYSFHYPDGEDKTEEEIKRETEARISVMKLLLENGADIDFFGADGYNALTETYFPETPEIMKFLLENGADPNHNCSIIDEPWTWYCHSGALNLVIDRISFEEMEYGKANDNLLAMEKLLKEYGAKQYIDGFDPDEYFGKD